MKISSLSVSSNISCIFCFPGGPRVLTNMSSGDIKAKEGDLVNLLCSGQGELPITFSWEKDQKSLKSFVEIEKPHRSSFLTVKMKDQTSFGKYICHIRDQFQSTAYTIWIQELQDTGIIPLSQFKKIYGCFKNKQMQCKLYSFGRKLWS